MAKGKPAKSFYTKSGAVSAHGRRESKKKGNTVPGTDAFPINNLSQLADAKHDIGRTKLPKAKVKAHINARAKALGGRPLGVHKTSIGHGHK